MRFESFFCGSFCLKTKINTFIFETNKNKESFFLLLNLKQLIVTNRQFPE